MTITIHCIHCNQALAVAPRKAATRIECPACGRGVAVPAAEPPTERAAAADAVAPAPSRPAETARKPTTPPDPDRPTTFDMPRSATLDAPAAAAVDRSRPRAMDPVESPVAAPPSPLAARAGPDVRRHGASIVLSNSVVVLALIFALGALGAAFLAGFYFAESRRPNGGNPVEPAPSSARPEFRQSPGGSVA